MINKAFLFSPGKLFDRKKTENIEEFMNIALKAHEYLETLKIEDKDGIYWAYPGRENGDGSIYTGSAGVLCLYLELYRLTGEKKYRDIIDKAADYIDVNWRKSGEAGIQMLHDYGIYEDLGTIYNYYSGAASCGEGLIAVYSVTGREKDKEAVRVMTDFIADNAKEDEDGPYWGVDCSMFHNAGTMIFLFHAV